MGGGPASRFFWGNIIRMKLAALRGSYPVDAETARKSARRMCSLSAVVQIMGSGAAPAPRVRLTHGTISNPA